MSDFLNKIQEATPEIKRRWLFAVSALAMMVIVYFWTAYFNNLVTVFSPAQGQADIQSTTQGQNQSFFDTIKSGMSNLANKVKEGPQLFLKLFKAEREYNITP